MKYPIPVVEALERYEQEEGPYSPITKEIVILLLMMANDAYSTGYREGYQAATTAKR